MWKGALVVAVVAAVAYSIVNQQQQSTTSISFGGTLGYPTKPPEAANLTPEEIADFHRDGFLLKKGVVSGDQLHELVEAGEQLYNSWSWMDFLFKASFAKLAMQIWREKEPFARLAFESSFPSIVAELLGLHSQSSSSSSSSTIRILKDGFFAFKPTNNTGCGFHVDDKGFWPATDDSTGVNFWLALSSYNAAEGGGIRVVNQSLIAYDLFETCKNVLRDPANPMSYNRTCSMHELSPSCHNAMMAASVVYDMHPGDALIWDRWTFHRSEPFITTTTTTTTNSANDDTPKLRYTIRYVPGTATALGMLHESVQSGERFHGPYYPQVWPTAVKEEVDAIRKGIEGDFALSPRFLVQMLARKLGLSV